MNLHAAILALSTTLLLLLLLPALYRLHTILSPTRPKPRLVPGENAHILIVLGSGGHTAEMLSMLSRAELDWKNKLSRRTWVVGEGDGISAERAGGFEREVIGGGEADEEGEGRWSVQTVPRARKIHQRVWTAPWSCVRCAWVCWGVLLPSEEEERESADFPDIILVNGPATATILVFVSVLMRFLDAGGCHSRGKMRTVYVESWARVKRVSLSGRLLGWVVDRFLVQWESLEGRVGGGRGEFVGVLV
ncbi:glycosyltransferase family 1 protein [Zasmidium cellare ATCC 36951]|uniref:UDP-N-acetylglucosamine transferase subunit ALG14 n=1 Tax=Zasmidium cellare ATCC 36951 TaxID=1080233 RepID=A0A6A6C2Z3_ZASCE|nr:glycosyltransferase family 1 protein [Zasmidium cellare ATCC 36951]KAF2159776.1 glycosyltransferase family 1 protein [Zasmidium cellare ATCC 36951]